MRSLWGALAILAACGTDGTGVDVDAGPVDWGTEKRVFEFGPYELAGGEEIEDDCVQISLHNETYIYINSVELTTGPGFHHSNWFWVPQTTFAGEDGTFKCDDRDFNEPVAAIFGGVLFAQSTQSPHEVQQFPSGVAIKIPPRAKIVTQIHLLNPTDDTLAIRPKIAVQPIAEGDVRTLMAGISFQNQSLRLDPNSQSRFSVTCDLGPKHRELFGRDPDFKIYYALAHYHDLATRLTLDAITESGETTTIYSTDNQIGDALGRMFDPQFSMSGFTKLRLSCEYTNTRAQTVRWGNGDGEMCVFLAFSDSTYNWGGGVNDRSVTPVRGVDEGSMQTWDSPCALFVGDASR
ncbi:MAG: hypothetical protein ACKV2T_21905 [Kofleriaceae bacterium]